MFNTVNNVLEGIVLGYLWLLSVGFIYIIGIVLFIALTRCAKDEDVLITSKVDKTILLIGVILGTAVWIVMWRSI